MPRDPRLHGLYAITRESGGNTQRLLREVESAIADGAQLVQYRDKSFAAARRLTEAQALRAITSASATLLIINDDIELAVAVNADGVHLGRNDADLVSARARLGPRCVIGVSCYNELERAYAAQRAGADYVAFGSFFPSPTKPHAVRADVELIRAWRNERIAACAIGGITLENAGPLVEAGVDMLAIITALWESDDVTRDARRFSRLFANPA